MTDSDCLDCGTETLPVTVARAEWYVVRADVWKASGVTPRGGCLCIGCLESRLGRRRAYQGGGGSVGAQQHSDHR